MSEENDGRLSFKEAVAHVMRNKQPAFAAVPVFGERTDDEEQTAEGVRVFIVEPDPEADGDDWRLRFIAGPFFSNAYAANEILAPEETPDSVRELRFMPTRCEEDWFAEQMQVLVQKLVKAAGIGAVQMPDYENVATPAAGPEAVFPVSFIGRDGAAH
ncbi:MAG: hypothetical protein AB1642_11590 [Pseudomonadota bacterium]